MTLQTPHVTGTGVTDARSAEHALIDAIVHTVAYVDVFDYPLTAEEVHRYLVGVTAPATHVYRTLSERAAFAGRLSTRDHFFTLPGREHIIEIRRHRQAAAKQLWPHALSYGRKIGSLPFVKMVAVTGSLAVDNVVPDADIDYLIVTERGRLWLSRAFTILVVRLAAVRGVTLCPNYFLAENALDFAERNLYTAHELVQMVPIYGLDVYHRLRSKNSWTSQFLPNASYPPRQVSNGMSPRTEHFIGKLAEMALRTSIGTHLERWEMNRKIAKFSRDSRAEDAEATFCPDWCKGHFDGHGHRILAAYENRISEING